MCCEEQGEGLSKDHIGCDAVIHLLLFLQQFKMAPVRYISPKRNLGLCLGRNFARCQNSVLFEWATAVMFTVKHETGF